MENTSAQKTFSDLNRSDEITLESKIGFNIVLIFLLVLTGLSLIFVVIRLFVAQLSRQQFILIDIPSLIITIFIAVLLTYFYYTRYVKRILILGKDKFKYTIGKREFEYSWSEFSLVVLSTVSASYGTKGFTVRLYEDDLESEYVEIPLYRFPNLNKFEYRSLIEDRVISAQNKTEV